MGIWCAPSATGGRSRSTCCMPITWASSVQTHVKADVNLKTLIGRGSGEGIQIGFVGTGWVLVQPSEGQPQVEAQGGGVGGGLLGQLRG